ncbi:MAG: polyprenol monophosphomannose synthase [Caldisericaceae bacterium]|nr:polyprenol monophosphomannose synthase [Caldisericaceae bacterium]
MVDPKNAVIVIPTYNEALNVERLVKEIRRHVPEISILFVDDNSPDGTADIIKELQKEDERIFLLERQRKEGLGRAYIAGFRVALEKGFDYIFEMDADFSHDPKELLNFLKEMQQHDLVIGSRYIKGVNVINWPLKRLLLSYFANLYTRIITGVPIADCTGGYKCFRKEVLQAIDFDRIKSNGYAFQIELNVKAWEKGFKIKEIPIIFVDRVYGESKLSKKIMWEAVFLVWKLRFLSLIKKL